MTRREPGDRGARLDYIVVGGGPAGCAVAARLADARPQWRIALIEAGPAQGNVFTKTPVGFVALLGKRNKYNYAFDTEPQSNLNQRVCYQPRGRGLGGSSLINGMIYIRGQADDYDLWAEEGCAGWGWSDVLPFFKKAEDNVRGASEFHGAGGPLHVDEIRNVNPMTDAFIEAAGALGYPRNADFNGSEQEGIGRYQVFQKEGRRYDAGSAYIHAKRRPNLQVFAEHSAVKIAFHEGRAAAVLAKFGNETVRISADREIILSAGAFGSPELLLRSGVGPSEDLQVSGIDVVADRREVGGNLQDHLDYIASRVVSAPGAIGFTPRALAPMVTGLVPFLRNGRGPLSSNVAEGGGFIRSGPDVERPDLQFHFAVALVDDHSRKLHARPGVSLHVCQLRPKSRGWVKLGGNKLLINPNFLADEYDMEVMIRGARIAERILDQEPFAKLGGRTLYPLGSTEQQIAESIRLRADTVYHPVGTCRMGGDPASVVDTRLRVRGVGSLRVADASVMPSIVSGNTQAPAAMIGERCADFIVNECPA